jgi:HSP20 family protein
MMILNAKPRTQGVRFYNPVFDRALQDFFQTPANGSVKTNPAVNIYETDAHFSLEVAAPGFDKADFNVTTEKEVLTIAAQKTGNEETTGTLRRKEFGLTEFKRTFHLPENVNAEAIEATYVNGILTVKLPKVVVMPTLKKIEIA